MHPNTTDRISIFDVYSFLYVYVDSRVFRKQRISPHCINRLANVCEYSSGSRDNFKLFIVFHPHEYFVDSDIIDNRYERVKSVASVRQPNILHGITNRLKILICKNLNQDKKCLHLILRTHESKTIGKDKDYQMLLRFLKEVNDVYNHMCYVDPTNFIQILEDHTQDVQPCLMISKSLIIRTNYCLNDIDTLCKKLLDYFIEMIYSSDSNDRVTILNTTTQFSKILDANLKYIINYEFYIAAADLNECVKTFIRLKHINNNWKDMKLREAHINFVREKAKNLRKFYNL